MCPALRPCCRQRKFYPDAVRWLPPSHPQHPQHKEWRQQQARRPAPRNPQCSLARQRVAPLNTDQPLHLRPAVPWGVSQRAMAPVPGAGGLWANPAAGKLAAGSNPRAAGTLRDRQCIKAREARSLGARRAGWLTVRFQYDLVGTNCFIANRQVVTRHKYLDLPMLLSEPVFAFPPATIHMFVVARCDCNASARAR